MIELPGVLVCLQVPVDKSLGMAHAQPAWPLAVDSSVLYCFNIFYTYWQFVTSFSFHRVWIAGHDHPLQVDRLSCLALHHLADQDLPVQVDPWREK